MTPDQYTNQEFMLDVGDGHHLYVQDWGNPKAKTPLLFLHGGPGASCKDTLKLAFDPKLYRVIFFDQRGCGKSTPYGSLEHNTTDDLIEDISKIAARCQLSSFVITGGSWGSCLALAYALRHPRQVRALVLRGIFTGSQAEIDYLDKGGFRAHFPEVWERYVATAPKSHHQDPSAYHYAQMFSGKVAAVRHSAAAYANMEGALLKLDDRYTPVDPNNPTYDPADTLIEAHYLKQRCFMPDRHILNNAHKLLMPIWLVQGRYDMVCPPATAYELHHLLPNSQLIFTQAGHSGSEREIDLAMRTILLQYSK